MKFDYEYLKEILTAMEDHKYHEITNFELMGKLNIDKETEDKFIGHIKALGDNKLIDADNLTHPYGFIKILRVEGYQIVKANYRLTSQGYEFLDILRREEIYPQLTNLALPTAIKIGTSILVNMIWDKIRNGKGIPKNDKDILKDEEEIEKLPTDDEPKEKLDTHKKTDTKHKKTKKK